MNRRAVVWRFASCVCLVCASMLLCACGPSEESNAIGNTARGKLALREYACDSCHQIPGIVGPDATVGPPLEHMARRFYIAGLLLNTPENMSRWIRHPKAIKPSTAMPDMGVSARDSQDMAAYLFTLK